MRKILVTLLLISSISVFGQNHFIGLQGGLNLTNVNSSNFIDETDNRIGINGGITYEYLFNNNFHLGTDFLYFQKGFTEDVTFTDIEGNPIGGKATSYFNYDYLSFPIKGGFSIGEKISGFVNLGLVPSILIEAKTKTPTIEGIINGETYNVTDKVTQFDIGALIEIGVGYKIKERLLICTSFGYHHSFTTLTNSEYFANGIAKHFGMELSFGIKYALKKE